MNPSTITATPTGLRPTQRSAGFPNASDRISDLHDRDSDDKDNPMRNTTITSDADNSVRGRVPLAPDSLRPPEPPGDPECEVDRDSEGDRDSEVDTETDGDSERNESLAARAPVARCADGNGTLTGLFFSDHVVDIARAKAMCALCPLSGGCLQDALEREEPWGVWGGELISGGRIVANKRPCGRPPKTPRPEVVYDEMGPVGVVA